MEEARRIARKFEIHTTPKHESWWNMAEIELGVVTGQWLVRRLVDIATVGREVAAWEETRNAEHATITWRFTTDKARETIVRDGYARLYRRSHGGLRQTKREKRCNGSIQAMSKRKQTW